MKLDPQCYKTKNLFFIRPNGMYVPCCYVSTNPQLETFLGQELYQQLNLTNYTYDEIVNSEAWKKIRSMIESDNPLNICKTLCSGSEKIDARADMINNIRVEFRNSDINPDNK